MAGTSRKKSASLEKGGKKPGKHVSDEQLRKDSVLFHDIWIIVIFVLMLFLFFANFGIIGPFGNAISGLLFGIFGFSAYIAPLVIAFGIIFWGINAGNPTAVRKIISGGILFLMFSVVCDLLTSTSISMEHYSLLEMFRVCRDTRGGGGVIAGSLTYLLLNFLELFGTILVVLLCSVICLIFLTEKSFVALIKQRGYQIKEKSARNRELRRELRDEAYEYEDEEYVSNRSKRQEARRLKEEEIENEKILRMKKKVSGVTIDTSLRKDTEKRRDDMHEITYEEEEAASSVSQNRTIDFNKVNIRTAHQVTLNEVDDDMPAPSASPNVIGQSTQETFRSNVQQPAARQPVVQQHTEVENEASVKIQDKPAVKKYMFPPLSRLNKGTHNLGDSEKELKETAIRLQNTLNTFGVNVTITDISQGPSVTRYELAPEQGVKVSKILSLSDDIKLNLAATDIRIEAPIPGKAAIGIEVPNKENMGVALRDLLESKEFVNFDSNLAFAVGKDISGQVVVGDIGKMPHMLIAGSTGSGKSVFINTLIMSILYKAHPDDVKLILVDPKVVELSVYNGIPHLLIPVVTDPKKASAALHWGVAEMEDRYKKFAEYNVRDLKGFNKMVESMRERGEEDAPSKMPQIVIVVDELADLMMVCAGEVEESICRLAQLARAAGIHLIIATQRPSVDVITGLIKANMPSRVAFAVSSGTDSRVVLDMNGAEKLLGKGDMLYYPQGYTKPARIQGAFVSDKEVSDVVDFLKNQTLGNVYVEDIEQKISSMGSSSTGGSSDGSGSDRDELFAEAGRTIIDKDKASIGMLQRMFKIGFNRAARIMDQLCEYGVVGDEEGTKPRKVLMSMEQFEQLLEEI